MIEEQPTELSVAIIKHRIKRYYRNPGVGCKIMRAADLKPSLIIAPLYSFLKEDHLDQVYSRLLKISPSTALITGRGTEWCRFPKAGLNPLENLKHDISYYPNLPRENDELKEGDGLDLLISVGEETRHEFFQNLKMIRRGGNLVRVDNSLKNYVIQKRLDNNLEFIYAREHNSQRLFDLYRLTFA
jgi:hypothetical protein